MSDCARVLVAEDDLAMSTLLRDYPEHHGYAVTLVHDGEAAARLATCRAKFAALAACR